MSWIEFPNTSHYRLHNAHVPVSLLVDPKHHLTDRHTPEGLVLVTLDICNGAITAISLAEAPPPTDTPIVDLKGAQVWPCFVDLHTHLDKGHIWPRTPNPDGTFISALETVAGDREARWNYDDVYRRFEFGLKCSYAHGTRAIRTHLDSVGKQAAISWKVFRDLRLAWADRLSLQAATILTLDNYCTPAGEHLADLVAESGGILGGVLQMGPDLEAQLERFFSLAEARHLSIDLHTDESGNPNDVTLRHVAKTAIARDFDRQIVCGHCCSLSVQPPDQVSRTIDLVARAGIGIVSLPMCNLYLQDRQQESSRYFAHPQADAETTFSIGNTPRWRGVTLLHELRQAGVPVAVANDNCRDPFHGFGDHDMLEVFNLSTRIAHFDMPYGNWPQTVTRTPADLMGLPTLGRIGVGLAADLVVMRGRNFSELLARPQGDRLVLRNGWPIDTTLPDYAELDDLMGRR